MVIRPDWRHFCSPLGKRLKRGATAILVIVFAALVRFRLGFEVTATDYGGRRLAPDSP
jgi:hypothetical protein